jgi:predicted enzyme involved in methoxymalonyl-ACP biosynthesis
MNLDALPIEKLQLKRKSLRRELLTRSNLHDVRIAVLGGSTTNELVDLLEVLLLDSGFRPTFYQSEYNRFYEDAVLEPHLIADFRPDLTYIHTTAINIQSYPPLTCTEVELPGHVTAEIERFRRMWQSLQQHVDCQIIQNNFETPRNTILGNLDAVNHVRRTKNDDDLCLPGSTHGRDQESCCACLPPVRTTRDIQFFQVKIAIAKGSNGEPGHEHPGTG